MLSEHWAPPAIDHQQVAFTAQKKVDTDIGSDAVRGIETQIANHERCIDEARRQWIDTRLDDEDTREAPVHLLCVTRCACGWYQYEAAQLRAA